jgi:hypothetical protein
MPDKKGRGYYLKQNPKKYSMEEQNEKEELEKAVFAAVHPAYVIIVFSTDSRCYRSTRIRN